MQQPEEFIQPTQEVGLSQEEAWKKGFIDINFFASLALPSVMLYPFPEFYCYCFYLLVNAKSVEQRDKIFRFALGLPRGHAKTTFIKVIIAWFIVYDRMSFIVIVGSKQGNANNIMRDINSILASPNMEKVYGKWYESLQVENADVIEGFYHGRVVTLMAIGAESGVRGTNRNNRRPEMILMDDMQTKENAKSDSAAASLKDWMVQTLMKCIEVRGIRLIVYIGNMYSDTCILYQLKQSPMWTSLITGAILEDGSPLWPDLHSIDSLIDSYLHDESLGEAEGWFAEVMNDPSQSNNSLLPKSLPQIVPESKQYDGNFITIDPAGNKPNSDNNVICVHGILGHQTVVRKVIEGNMSPEMCIKNALASAIEYQAWVIGIEDVAYQSTLAFWMNKYIEKLELTGILIVPLQPKGRSKQSRIEAYIRELYETSCMFETAELRALFVFQALKYKKGKKNNVDDYMDCAAYGLDMRNDYAVQLSQISKMKQGQLETPAVVEDNTPF